MEKKTSYSVEVDSHNGAALADCLKRLADGIPNFEYDWHTSINAGGIDYGIYINVDIEKKEVEICNQPEYGTDGDDCIDDILENFEDEYEEDEEG